MRLLRSIIELACPMTDEYGVGGACFAANKGKIQGGYVAVALPLQLDAGRVRAVAIGASTGSPAVIERMMAMLPADIPVPILIAQHLPPQFTGAFAAAIDRNSALSAFEAEDGMSVLPGAIYVGRGHQHLRVVKVGLTKVVVQVSPEPQYLIYKPSADELFRSCAKVYGPGTLAIVLSGIGRDGLEGARSIKEAGGLVVTQSQASCAVYGMPRSVAEASFSDAQLSPEEIAQLLLQLSPQYGSNK